jgi:WD40 repeat protein
MPFHPPLLDLLGARWQLGAAVAGVAWSSDGTRAAFALTDGTLALARAAWEGGPVVAAKPGGVEVVPPRVASPPFSRVAVHRGACRALATDPDGAFLSGGDDGRLARVSAEGRVQHRHEFPGRAITHVAAAAGVRVCAASDRLRVIGPQSTAVTLPAEASALALHPTLRRLAVGHAGGIALWAEAAAPPPLACDGTPAALAWSPDGHWLVAAFSHGGLRAWSWPPAGDALPLRPAGAITAHHLAFGAAGRLLAVAGGMQATCWEVSRDGFADAAAWGLASSATPVAAIACHPHRALLAAGYANGAVALGQPGTADTLFAKPAGGGAVTALAFAPDGSRLAIATAEGEAGLLLLPDALLRDRAAAMPERAA